MVMLHPGFESLSPSAVREHQDALWQQQWPYIRSHSAFYGVKLGQSVPETLGIDALRDLPFTDKDELRCSQKKYYPFGEYIACPEESVVRIHRTSGTTGRALQLANSRRDIDLVNRVGGRSQFSAGLRPTDRVIHCLNYCL